MSFHEVSTQIDFPSEEIKVLKYWQDGKIFEKSVNARPREKEYSFYDGPPFATGLPHYGHLLASVLKDIVPRYWTMRGRRVERRFGWDCHGLPIEYEIDKTLGISGRKGVEEFGIAKYNQECRGIVLRFTEEWEKTITRVGRWVDFRHDYKTMDANFMESVWWVFKQLWDKGLVYQSYRVMPYSTAVATPLSNFEAGSNYKEHQDPAITVRFRAIGLENTSFLAWTTTPWTLPSNMALTMGHHVTYVKLYSRRHNEYFILGEKRVENYFPKQEDYEIVERFNGQDLEGQKYEPLFTYFSDRMHDGAFKIIVGEHVTDADGTGIVHTAPAFGEEDFEVCKLYSIPLVMPIDDDGRFTSAVQGFAGRHIKEADKDIIHALKENGKLFRHDTITHSIPFCWRSDTPLIYRAVSGWFINISKIKERLIAANARTHWVPETLRDGRFGNWLADARDWNVSRNRYWGNPIPLWYNKDTGKYICIGSIRELEDLSEKKIADLHREHLDEIVIPDKNGKGSYRRVSEVLDCWFESGAMPYAQSHYPFENKESFEKNFPADFIAEGLDQTRGWFYTLSVLGTALFDTSPFKNVIVNGLILAEDGKKMSKRLKNYPDPNYVLDTYGADALRLYLINSPVVRAEELRFSEAGVKDVVRRVLLKWWNAYSFFVSYAVVDKWGPPPSSQGGGGQGEGAQESNILDRWILSRLQSLLSRTEKEMAEYHLYNVVPALLDFIEDLTNTYIRLNRKRFWSEEDPSLSADKNAAFATLYEVLFTLTKIMAPFTPFLSETMFKNLRHGGGKESVHLEDYPTANETFIEAKLEESVALMNHVILMARNVREKINVKVKIPLKKLSIIHRDENLLAILRVLENYLKEELNVREVEYLTSEDDFVELTAKANGAVLGKKLGAKFSAINKQVQGLTGNLVSRLERGETLVLDGENISRNEVFIYRKAKKGYDHVVSDAFITVNLDVSLDEDQIQEGLAREVVNRIQKLRKTAGLNLSDRIRVEYRAEPTLAAAMQKNDKYVMEQTLAVEMRQSDSPQGQMCDECDVDGMKILLALTREK